MKKIILSLPGLVLVVLVSWYSVTQVVAAQGQVSPPVPGNNVQAKRVDVALFSKGDFATAGQANWDKKSFKGETSYQIVEDVDKGRVLRGISNGTASAFGRSIRIDLIETPYLHWTWKIDKRLDKINETSRGGDDFAARIYVVKKAGMFGRKSKAVNYVWSSNQSRGTSWSNAFRPNNSKMIAVRGIEDEVDHWVVERHNVAEDFQRLFGSDVKTIDALVIMTDTDNTGLSASASYGDIFFSSE